VSALDFLSAAARAELEQLIDERVAQRLAEHTAAAPAWFTVRAAADYLGLTEHAVRKLVERQRISKHQHVEGGRIMLRRADLDAYLDDGRHGR
jgi:excisionase family DNA binding protein